MADVPPKQKTTPRQKIAQFVRMLGVSEDGEWETSWRMLIREMKSAGLNFNDLGNWVAQGERDEGLYTEAELVEFAQLARAEGVEEGIKIGQARIGASGTRNGHLVLPQPVEMAEFCSQRLTRLRSDREREFIAGMVARTQHGGGLTLRTLGYLASLYIGVGGKT